MKVRNDFVTNSSSSSYILAFKRDYDEKGNATERTKILTIIFDADSDVFETEKGIYLDSVESYNNYFVTNNSWCGNSLEEILNNEPEMRKNYDKCIDFIKRGYTVVVKEVDESDLAMMAILTDLHKMGIVTLIDE